MDEFEKVQMEEADIPEEEFCNRHYVRVRADGCVIDGWSDGPHNTRAVTEEDILINARGGYQFRLPVNSGFQGENAEFPALTETEENPPFYTDDGIPLYLWDGEAVRKRTEEEIEAERALRPAPEPSAAEDRDAMIVDHELRLTLLELGLNE